MTSEEHNAVDIDVFRYSGTMNRALLLLVGTITAVVPTVAKGLMV